MDFFQAILNMLAGSVYLMLTRPLEGGLVAYLSTTFLIFVALPGCVGILFSIIGKTPRGLQFDTLISRWWRWWIATPLSWTWQLARWIARGLWRFVRYGFDGPPPPRRRP